MKTAPTLAVFRANAGPAIGVGHVMRCLALADAMMANGWRCLFVVNEAAPSAAPVLEESGHAVLTVPSPDESGVQRFKEWTHPGATVVVIDGYTFGTSVEQAWRSVGSKVLVIDDLADRRHDCDLLLDQTLGRDEADYWPLVPSECQLLLGTEFALLRPEFAWRRPAALRRRQDAPARGILVSLGAGGPGDLICAALDGLAALELDAIDVVVGAGHPERSALEAKALAIGRHVRVLADVRNMADLMASADLAVGAAGMTSWERCCLGLPSLMIVTADNQRANAERLQAAGAARLLGVAGEVTAAAIASGVSSLLDDHKSLSAMSRAAASVCDGRGANRAISIVLPETANTGEPVWLRPARMVDARTVFEWQTIPGLRRFSRTPRAPAWDEHKAWMKRKLDDPDCLLSIIMLADRPAGVLRLDRLETRSHEVSILVAPIAQGIGVGRAALDCAVRLVPETRLCAHILPANKTSQHLFAAAGYRNLDSETGTSWIREPKRPAVYG